jgi:hypothetical protein
MLLPDRPVAAWAPQPDSGKIDRFSGVLFPPVTLSGAGPDRKDQ